LFSVSSKQKEKRAEGQLSVLY